METRLTGDHATANDGSFANCNKTCSLASISAYQLLRLTARGEIRTRVNPFGRTLYHIGDARKYSGGSALD